MSTVPIQPHVLAKLKVLTSPLTRPSLQPITRSIQGTLSSTKIRPVWETRRRQSTVHLSFPPDIPLLRQKRRREVRNNSRTSLRSYSPRIFFPRTVLTEIHRSENPTRLVCLWLLIVPPQRFRVSPGPFAVQRKLNLFLHPVDNVFFLSLFLESCELRVGRTIVELLEEVCDFRGIAFGARGWVGGCESRAGIRG